ncbi:aldo/keto reductase [Chryseobacterium sp. cx-311]|uniref:aldo/keto reductase n=1 Tax=Marnyiella aurantia TaxID=2758037 RepID=UPI001AE1D870|nr:aldo/keto reductase [Marnyiella aurantia]MBP0613005.1 aldo/keto reductase [Marnyiella aurantia]
MTESIRLNDGLLLPPVGFGTYKAESTAEAVRTAVECGYRLIDTASVYGNETEVGQGLESSGVNRGNLFVTSKVWRTDLGYDAAKKAFEASLKRLSLDYLDLYLIHWPANSRNFDDWADVNSETWCALEDLQQEGLIKSIGVSNFWPEHLEKLLKRERVVPAVNQLEFHPGYQQRVIIELCRQHNITVQAWSPLARGRLAEDEVLNVVASKYGKSVSQIILRWTVQQNIIPIPKSANSNRIKENIDIFDFELSAEDMSRISAIPQKGFSGERPDLWPDRQRT